MERTTSGQAHRMDLQPRTYSMARPSRVQGGELGMKSPAHAPLRRRRQRYPALATRARPARAVGQRKSATGRQAWLGECRARPLRPAPIANPRRGRSRAAKQTSEPGPMRFPGDEGLPAANRTDSMRSGRDGALPRGNRIDTMRFAGGRRLPRENRTRDAAWAEAVVSPKKQRFGAAPNNERRGTAAR